jgi:hypothetical protein
MSLVRFIPAWLHAIADYAVAFTLIVVALAVGGSSKAVAAGVVIGAVVLVVSMLTRYPLGLIKVLPFKVHSAGDYLAAALLVASPFALGFSGSDRGLTILYIGAGVAVLGVSLITNYQYSPRHSVVSADEQVAGGGRGETLAPPVPAPSVPPSWQAEPRGAESWRSEPATEAVSAALVPPAPVEFWRGLPISAPSGTA